MMMTAKYKLNKPILIYIVLDLRNIILHVGRHAWIPVLNSDPTVLDLFTF